MKKYDITKNKLLELQQKIQPQQQIQNQQQIQHQQQIQLQQQILLQQQLNTSLYKNIRKLLEEKKYMLPNNVAKLKKLEDSYFEEQSFIENENAKDRCNKIVPYFNEGNMIYFNIIPDHHFVNLIRQRR